ncbi:MAG: glycoside hydrolase family 3 C-terminal domain-containing protein [Salinivenus sp.]
MAALLLLPVIGGAWGASILLLGALVLGAVSAVRARGVDGPVEALIEAMTLEEKLALLHGAEDPAGRADTGYVSGVPRLGVPPLRVTDGRGVPSATALPAPISLGASFLPSLARTVGAVQGRESRDRGQNVVLAPNIDVLRVPEASGAAESIGEDPFLIGRIAAEQVKGIQGAGTIATVRHFLAHTFEADRDRVSVEVSDRALRELYLPGVRSAVEAGAGSVMGAPNRINGTFACDHEWLLSGLLKEDLGFEGWVMSSWHARHSLEALSAGLDQEMPGGNGPADPQAVYFDEPLRRAVEDGRLPEERVDASVGRILRQMQRVGLLDEGDPARSPAGPKRGATVAREAARAGAVLLHNEHDALPLPTQTPLSLAVVGPAAVRCPSGPRTPAAEGADSPLAALRHRLGPAASIRHEPGVDLEGTPVPASALSPSASLSTDGLRRTSTDDVLAIDPVVDFTGPDALPADTTCRWSGTLTAPQDGAYTLRLQTRGGWACLSLDGEPLAATGGEHSTAEALSPSGGGVGAAADLRLSAGETREVTIAVDGTLPSGPAATTPLEVRFSWVPPDRQEALRRRAAAAAREADAAVVFGHDREPGGRGDALSLPRAQSRLLRAVADASASTTVVLNTGRPTTMPWLDAVDAVLQMWYPGQEGGDATAALLTGADAPGGRLPVTVPRHPDETPTHPPERYPGVNGKVQYDESVFVGYRWYDHNDVEPLFPFGHGLTYTSFAYSDLSVQRRGTGWDVRFRVRNTGTRSGAAVPQVYVGRPASPPVEMPPKELAAIAKVELAPGEAATVCRRLGRRAFSYWSEADDRWRVAAGARPILVGASARRVRLEATTHVD